MNAFRIVDKKPKGSIITLIGSGAANIRTAYVLMKWGIKPGNIIMTETKGILSPSRKDIKKDDDPCRHDLPQTTNADGRGEGLPEALKGVDVVVAASKSGPGTLRPEWIEKMADRAIVFVCATPIPEIWPWEAEEAGAKVDATWRSDFPNHVNNSLGFPAIFRGVLDVKARTVTDDMCIAATIELAKFAEEA